MSIAKSILAVVVVIAGCVALATILMLVLRMDYVPTPAQVNAHKAVLPFQVKSTSLQGVYGNADIDTIVFRYTTTSPNVTAFKTQLDKQAGAAGWTPLPAIDNICRFERITPKGNRMFCGSEEVRVRLHIKMNRVDVAWVQGDSFDDVTSFSETHESEWAQSEVWPRMDTP